MVTMTINHERTRLTETRLRLTQLCEGMDRAGIRDEACQAVADSVIHIADAYDDLTIALHQL